MLIAKLPSNQKPVIYLAREHLIWGAQPGARGCPPLTEEEKEEELATLERVNSSKYDKSCLFDFEKLSEIARI